MHVFDNSIDLCLGNKSYGLDIVWYCTTPALSWECMLKYTQVDLELLTDYLLGVFVL